VLIQYAAYSVPRQASQVIGGLDRGWLMNGCFKITKLGVRQVLPRCDLGHDQQARCIDTVERASTGLPGHHQRFRLCTGERS
jgi:hypothetical protein